MHGFSGHPMQRMTLGFGLAPLLWAVAAWSSGAQAAPSCQRPLAGAAVARPPDLYSQYGLLKLALNYVTAVDAAGRTLFCFVTPDGMESPTLHVNPGDTLDITVTNTVPALPSSVPVEIVSNAGNVCGDKTMTGTSVNMHFHGTNTSPACHADNVIHTIINSGQSFHFFLAFPPSEPPGLYWYHPHVHGNAEAAVLGGASGAIVVGGIQNLQPIVTGLPERILVIRDQNVGAPVGHALQPAVTRLPEGSPAMHDQNVGAPPAGNAPPPAWDVSLNYVPVSYPAYTPAILNVTPGQQELWRVVNAAADTVADLQLVFDGKAQPLQVVGLDGVPNGSQDGTGQGQVVTVTHILIPPAGRAEFVVSAPPSTVKSAALVTQAIDTGPIGDFDPKRTLAVLRAAPGGSSNLATIPAPTLPTLSAIVSSLFGQLFAGLDNVLVQTTRTLYFSEVLSDPHNPASPTNFYITVDGATPVLFDPNNPPAIITKQGAVEDWTIQNRAGEVHEFHMHQIHFKLMMQNGVPVPSAQSQLLDTINIPYWTGKGPYPSVTVRMDFRAVIPGDFVYHCHILGHEDNGMMAIIRVLPAF